MKSVYLYPAQLYVSKEPTEIKTILGSCVAVAMFCESTKIAGLNHYLLANCKDFSDSTPDSLRYGNNSIKIMHAQLLAAGAISSKIKAKIYGGAAVLENNTIGSKVGVDNVEIARKTLEELKIPIIEENIGGKVGRRIVFDTNTLEVKHELIQSSKGNVSYSDTILPTMRTKVKVLIVDDSITIRQIFSKMLGKDPRIEVVGIAADAYEARELLINKKPDLIFLDIEMPKINGVVFLEKIMTFSPTPTIIVSSLGAHEEAAQRCLDLGAVEFINKPSQFDPTILRTFAESLADKAVAAASVPLQTLVKHKKAASTEQDENKINHQVGLAKNRQVDFRSQVILVGGNSGAQKNIGEFLASLPTDSPPVVISISSVTPFLKPLIETLKTQTSLVLKIALHDDIAMRGHVYFAPPEKHLELEKIASGNYKIKLSSGAPVLGQIPSSSKLFQSVLNTNKQNTNGIIGALFSGYGNDGVQALLSLRESGALTLVIPPTSAAFAFLPENAISAGAATEVIEPQSMGKLILGLRNKVVS